MRILVLGDSVVLHRPWCGQPIDETWPVILGQKLGNAEVWQRARPNATSIDVAKEFYLFSNCIEYFDAFVVQVGIVDSPPRPHPYILQQLIWMYGSLKFQKYVNHNMYKLLKFRAKPWVSRERFSKELNYIASNALEKKKGGVVVFIKIAPPCFDLPKKIPGIGEYVEEYNETIQAVVDNSPLRDRMVAVDPYRNLSLDEMIIQDGHHLTSLGHRVVADAVASEVRRYLLVDTNLSSLQAAAE